MPEPTSMPSKVVVPKPLSLPRKAMASAIYFVIRFVAATLRGSNDDKSRMLSGTGQGQAIFAIWHNRLALSLVVYRVFIQPPKPDRRLAAIVSASRDGGVVARVLEHFGVKPVRGSSSRRGAQALLELTSSAEEGLDIAITPDGPRGPCYVVQDGVIALAQLTGLPVVPVSYHLNWKIRLKSWDRFQIPLPFARWQVRMGEPIRVPRDASDEQREALRQELQTRMMAITQD